MNKSSRYYDRQGKELDLLEWGRLFEDKEYQCVKQDQIGKYLISTVWIGINLGLFTDHFQIFETMIFNKEGTEDYQDRYETEEEAIAGHKIAVEYVNNLIKQEETPESQAVESDLGLPQEYPARLESSDHLEYKE